MRRRGANQFLLETGALLTCLILTHVAWQHLVPRPTGAVLHGEAGETTEVPLPLRWPSSEPTIDVEFSTVLGRLHPRLYHFDFAGCLEDFAVNGEPVRATGLATCGPGGAAAGTGSVDLASHLHPGLNEFRLRIRRELVRGAFTVHNLSVRASTRDPIAIFLTATLVFLIGAYGLFLARQLGPGGKAILGVFVGGAVLRVIYVIGTDVSARSYDWHGHLVYVTHFAEHLSIPPAQLGWQTYQPPLFYALCGSLVHLGSLLGRSLEASLQHLQVLSLLFSLGALAAGIWVGTMLFPARSQRRELLLFAGTLAVFPGVVFFASRVSNDVAYHLFAVLFLGLMLRFWQRGRKRDWWLLSLVIGLALLTKSHALLFVPIAWGCLLLQKDIPGRERAALLALSLVLLVSMAGWFYVLRFVVEGEQSVVGNIHRFPRSLRIENSIADFVVFDPLEVIDHPFVDDRGRDLQRATFWEYLFRTAHFGGFRLARGGFIVHSSVLLLCASMLLLPLVPLGMWRDLRLRSPTLPLWATTITLLGAQVGYRLQYPFSFNQDFRFSVLITIPFTYYALTAMQRLPGPLRSAATAVMISFISLSAVLLVALGLDP